MIKSFLGFKNKGKLYGKWMLVQNSYLPSCRWDRQLTAETMSRAIARKVSSLWLLPQYPWFSAYGRA